MSTEPITTAGELDPKTPYIRTFAKDYAALSGGDPKVAAKLEKQAKKQKPKKEKKSKKPKRQEFTLTDEQDASLMVTVHPDAPPLDLNDTAEIQRQSETIEEKMRRLAPADLAQQAPLRESLELPTIAPGDIVPQETDRASVLARLKARALENDSDHALAPIVPLAQAEDLPEPPKPKEKKEKKEKPKKEKKQKVRPSKEEVSPIHTFTTDFQDHIKDENASAFAVLAAEKDAAPPKPASVKRDVKGPLAIALGIILLIAGAGGVYAAYLYVSKNAPVLSIPTMPSLITPDSRVMLTGTGEELLNALSAQAAQPLADGDVALTYINESTTTAQGVVEEPATGGAFITELNLSAPDILIRNIDPSSMVGIVSADGETHPFFILRVASYERTFAGMLQWEPALYGQLSMLFPEYPAPAVPAPVISTAATTTATSTKSTTKQATKVSPVVAPVVANPNANLPAGEFVDETVASHTVRALKDNSGRTLVLYGYADKATLIIARNEAAFTLLLNRLSAGT